MSKERIDFDKKTKMELGSDPQNHSYRYHFKDDVFPLRDDYHHEHLKAHEAETDHLIRSLWKGEKGTKFFSDIFALGGVVSIEVKKNSLSVQFRTMEDYLQNTLKLLSIVELAFVNASFPG